MPFGVEFFSGTAAQSAEALAERVKQLVGGSVFTPPILSGPAGDYVFTTPQAQYNVNTARLLVLQQFRPLLYVGAGLLALFGLALLRRRRR